ncbi:Importin-11 [Homalodisca vitripennis]|nr:Importin-11 [Homalodisca vitripennis]
MNSYKCTHYGEALIRNCVYLLSDMRNEGIIMTMRLLELCLRANPSRSIMLLEPILPQAFQSVYQGEEYPMVMAMYLSIIARVLLISRETFGRGMVHLADSLRVTLDTVTAKIMDVWLEKMSLVTQPERSKLLALALCSLLTSQNQIILDRFPSILLFVTEVLNDITRLDDIGVHIENPGLYTLPAYHLTLCEKKPLYIGCKVSNHLLRELQFKRSVKLRTAQHTWLLDIPLNPSKNCSLMWSGPDSSPNSQYDEVDYKTEHDQRREQLAATDPVYQLELLKYFRSQLLELQNQVGPVVFAHMVQRVDGDTLQQVREYVPL